VPVASGDPKHRGDAAIQIKQKDASLYAARLDTGASVRLPAAPYVHLFVARGAVELAGAGRLNTGDAVRIVAADGQSVTATEPAEILVWEMHARIDVG
jgi:redox-sensitive bicupin YhaK (pirin superfamily)